MIIDLHKVLLYGAKEEMDRFFMLAQRAGFCEFIGTERKKSLELPPEAKTLVAAIKIAKRHTIHPADAPAMADGAVSFAEKIVAFQAQSETLREQARMVKAEIARICVFGDFSIDELKSLEQETKRVFQFFCMKTDLAHETVLPKELIYVGTEYDLDYFVSIQQERAQYPKMMEILIEEPVGVLRDKQAALHRQIAAVEADLRLHANALYDLQHGLVIWLNEYRLNLAKHDAAIHLNGSLFFIEAWIPATRLDALKGLISHLDVQYEEIAVDPSEPKPTYMENHGASKMGEDLVQIYDTPSPTDKDPSMWVLTFFSLFFAMIISDAGYGLIYLLIGLFLRWKIPNLAGNLRRLVKTILLCATTCILWGVATASYFGIEIGPDNPLRTTSFLHYLASQKAEYHYEHQDDVYHEYVREFPAVAQAQDGHAFLVLAARPTHAGTHYVALEEFYDNLLMEFSFLVGIIHIGLSLLRYSLRNKANIGWVMFMAGGYLFFPSILDATTLPNILGLISKPVAHFVGEWLVYSGIV
ncbi:MAG: V-type synthase subunit, partial [Chlamydiota bacterium]